MRNLLPLLVLGLIVTSIGCQSEDPFRKVSVPEAGPTGLDEQQFHDVPVPRGFRLVTERSFSYRTGDLRLGQHFYEGSTLDAGEALDFYAKEMVRPLYGWTMVVREKKWATFRKDRDEALVTIEAVGEQTRITVNVNYTPEDGSQS
jgi:hypothetical protein